MSVENSNQRTPEEIIELEKSRTISDAELLKGGAEYAVDEKRGKGLRATGEQIENIHDVFERKETEMGKLQYTKESAKEIKFFHDTVSKYIGRDIVQLLSENEKLIESGERFNEHIEMALDKLRQQFIDSVQKSGDTSPIAKERVLRRAGTENGDENLFNCAGCMSMFLNTILPPYGELWMKLEVERKNKE